MDLSLCEVALSGVHELSLGSVFISVNSMVRWKKGIISIFH